MDSFFLQGLQHPFLTPAHLIVMVALGIFLGQQNKTNSDSRISLAIFITSTLAGLAITRFYRPDLNLEMFLLILAGIMGLLIAVKLSLPSWFTLIVGSITGIIIGLDSAPVIIPGLKASKVYLDMAGTLTSVSLILLVVGFIALLLNRLWQGIVLRIIGSWVFASALMVLALSFAPTNI